ncbi:MAG: hypothetical protein OHK93_008444 [Ramalina farinacea]|uniref:Uncharacterized protein n=1 Tax=Ramalina farinacea TaxID=258253 RepID=A0AA43TRW6_9LECA|nr:hypothetical protein [Ramalina farinacea]
MAGPTMRPRKSKPAPQSSRSAKSRNVRRRITYAEPASDPEDDDSQEDYVPPQITSAPRRGRSGAPPAMPAFSRVSKKRKASGRDARERKSKVHRLGQSRKWKRRETPSTPSRFAINLTGKTMPWHTLPYHILELIFDYASYPLIRENFFPNPSVDWLCKLARLCKGFTEPALSVLYASPPLYPPARVRSLIKTLEITTPYTNYRGKIRRIDVEAIYVLSRKSGGLPPLDISDLLSKTPQVRGIGLHMLSTSDRWGMSTHHVARNIYGRSFWETLDQTGIRLPNLRHLAMRNSELVDDGFLIHLPANLQSLEISNCPVESNDVTHYIQAKGQNLRSLTLDHNQHLNLSFLHILSTSCPLLEVLKMDLIYHSPLQVVAVIEPQYDQLLCASEMPTWPSTIQSIELYHLRRWTTAVAKDFFQGLVDAAPGLRDLRQLKIKASLDESGWRDRVAFRDFWIQRMSDVFQRHSSPPNPHLKSLSAFQDFKARQQRKPVRGDARRSSATLQHVKIPVRQMESINVKEDDESDSDRPLANVRRSRRSRPARNYDETSSTRNGTASSAPSHNGRSRRRRVKANPDDTSDEDSSLEDQQPPLVTHTTSKIPTKDPAYTDQKDGFPVQGMCNVVEVMIDNQRPAEEQLHETDFLDEEVSGDEDWNGDDDLMGDSGYAW